MEENKKSISEEELCVMAKAAMDTSYSPYSHCAVGAALLCADGTVYTGANIENAAFSPTICAERVAFARAIHDGQRNFLSIAVAGGREGIVTTPFAPCGVCRQVMAEFCSPAFRVLLVTSDGYLVRTLGELLPDGFSPSDVTGAVPCTD